LSDLHLRREPGKPMGQGVYIVALLTVVPTYVIYFTRPTPAELVKQGPSMECY
jgi:hypothetical protein